MTGALLMKRVLLPVLILACVGVASNAEAHRDDGVQEIDDIVKLTNITARALVAESTPLLDDGGNGNTEYCVRVTITHSGHEDVASSESFNCGEVDWDANIPGSDPPQEFEAREAPPAGSGVALMPLMPGRFGDGPWSGKNHARECTGSEFWSMSVRMTEETPTAAEITAELIKALKEAKLPNQPSLAAGVAIAGPALGFVTAALDKIFATGTVDLGRTDLTWGATKGDPNTKNIPPDEAVPRKGSAGGPSALSYFQIDGVKDVTDRNRSCPPPPPPPAPEEFGCLDDPNHLFSESAAVAARPWDIFVGAVGLIDGVAAETGNAISQTTILQKRQAFREFGASMGAFIAQTELDEAVASPGTVEPTLLSAALGKKLEADAQRDQALAEANTPLLLSALSGYRQAFNLLAPSLHPECINALTVGGSVGLIGQPDASAELAPSSGADATPIAAVAGGAAVIVLLAGGWYARRRFSRN